jgi:hypothetical protein
VWVIRFIVDSGVAHLGCFRMESCSPGHFPVPAHVFLSAYISPLKSSEP